MITGLDEPVCRFYDSPAFGLPTPRRGPGVLAVRGSRPAAGPAARSRWNVSGPPRDDSRG